MLKVATKHLVWQREYRFHPERKWRSDFAIWSCAESRDRGDLPLLVEIEGAKYGAPGRHQRVDGIDADCEKYANAMLLGHTVLRVSARQVQNGKALQWIEQLLQGYAQPLL